MLRTMLPAGDAELVRIFDAALDDAARRAGGWLACRPGCSQCCYGAFAIDALDAERLAEAMRRLWLADPSRAGAVEARASEWIRAHAAEFPGDAKNGILGASPAEQERFEEFANEAPCPALDPETGRCEVYAGRPMTCRVFGPPVRSGEAGALGHCELCFQGAPTATVLACEMQVPVERETQLLDELGDARETVVAYALLRGGRGSVPVADGLGATLKRGRFDDQTTLLD